MDKVASVEPWFGIEQVLFSSISLTQIHPDSPGFFPYMSHSHSSSTHRNLSFCLFCLQEYTLYEPDGVTPYGVGLVTQAPSYCAVGTGAAFGRPVAEAHYKACMYAGINISGVNDEVSKSQKMPESQM